MNKENKPNIEKAKYYFKIASELGYVYAFNNLGKIFETEDENETNKTKPPVNETVPPEPSEPPEKPVVHPPVEKKIPHIPVSTEATGNPLFLLILAIMMSFTQFKPKK